MIRAGIPLEGRLWVLIAYRERLTHKAVSDGQPIAWEGPFLPPLARSRIVRRGLLASEIERSGTKSVQDRATGRQYLLTYGDWGHRFGRSNLIDILLAVEKVDEAEWWVGEWRREKEPFEDTAVLSAIGHHYAKTDRAMKAVDWFKQAVQSDIGGAQGDHAKIELSRIYRAIGDEAKMVEVLMDVAKLGPDGKESNSRNAAVWALAAYYTEKKEWAEALKWWEHCRASSLCGTCQRDMEKQLRDKITECQDALKRPMK